MNDKLAILLDRVGDMALKRRAGLIIESINPKTGERILDVGCGDGFYLHILSNLGLKLKLIGVDFDPNALESAKDNLKKDIPLYQADLMKKLPFTDKSFDKIIVSEVIEHLPNDLKGLREIYRVLKPGGIVVFSVPNQNYTFLWDPPNWFIEKLTGTHISHGFWAGIWNQHFRLYKQNEFVTLIKKAGYKVLDAQSLTWFSLPFNHHLINLFARMLVGKTLSKDLSASINKFNTVSKRPYLLDIAFKTVNTLDKLNDRRLGDIGVSLVCIAKR
jgi:ubiquinone/menaquinone biosynthesis C-methylase UbiE